MTFPLRPYQAEAIEAVRAAYTTRNIRRPLVVLPTGAGKTVVFSHLAAQRAQHGRTLIIAHREELIAQAAAKVETIGGGLRVGIVKAERNEHVDSDVIVASIQTIARPHRLAPLLGTIATIVVDEAHHAAADTYRAVLEQLGSFEDNGPLTVGVTATPSRGDGVGLDCVWQEIVYQRGIFQMIAEGYLVDVSGMEVVTDLDYGRLRTRGGDYTDGSLGQEMDRSGVLEAAALGYVKYARDRRGVAFTPTIDTAHQLAGYLRANAITAEPLSGQTPADERRAILRRLSSGDTQVVTNCAVLTEGFDEPALSCALIARPTKNAGLFTQMAGRVLRPHPTKQDALLLTLFGQPDTGLASLADLTGLDPTKVAKVKAGESLSEAVAREEEERGRELNGRRVASIVTGKQIDLFHRSKLQWIPSGDVFVLPCGQTSVCLTSTGRTNVAGEPLWDVVEAGKDTANVISPGLALDWAQGVGEEYARAHGANIARSDARWRRTDPTDAQVKQLRKLRIPIPKTKGEASDALSAAFAARDLQRMARAR